MPTDTMTTKRISFQQQQQTLQNSHHHHQQQRRPPDVEEALSSMLWTPYERASTTDTSSDDDDEQLQRQLKKSKSQYDYTSVPTTIPPLTPPPPPLPSLASLGQSPSLPPTHFPLTPTHLTPTNIVAYITAATPARAATTAAAVAATSLISTTSAYYTTEDLCDPSVTTPLVPFSNLMLNAHTAATPNHNRLLNTAITAEHDDDDEIDEDDDVNLNVDVDVDDTFNDVYNNENTLAATSSSMMMMSSYQQKNRISYPSTYGRIPNLTKWWSTSNAATTQQLQPTPVPSTTHQQSAVESTPAAAVTLLPPPPPQPPTTTLTVETNKQPPSYESLYKKHPLRPLRQRQHRLNKHLNLFKPVLETLKANVTTITQGRFTSLTRPDHNRVTNANITSAINPTTTTQQPTTVVIESTAASTTAGITIRNDNCSTESTSNNLVHSFTDNFLHEHCPTTQHVAATNVDNEHIININNNNNNNTTTENINGETPIQQQALIHQQQQYTHEQIQVDANTKSKQNQENENKQNNNFIICQQQQHIQKQLQNPTTTYEEHPEKETCKREAEMNTNELTIDRIECEHKMNAPLFMATTTNASTTTSNMTGSLFYDSSSAISLTRSFEANTSYTVGLTDVYDSFNTDLQDETRKTTTYSLTPNKCLAELERLYAEFRASESLREQKLRESQNQLEKTETDNMRLNVPASTTNSVSKMATEVSGKSVSETRLNPSTSSVFLTTTNSVTTITNPCQRTPSLTIQVNQNVNVSNANNNSNNNNNNNNYNNNTSVNNGGGGQHENNESQQHQVVLNQAIVNTTTNGVSVINCNYVNNVNNNNNKSITNLCDNATNTNNSVDNITTATNNNVGRNPKNNHCSPNHDTNSNNISKNINDNCSGSGNSDIDPPHSSVPQVLSVNNVKDHVIAKNYQKHLNNAPNTQVKVIQVNEVAPKANNTSSSSSSSTPTSSPQRTFTSTECQTDDISAVQLRSPSATRPALTSTSSANSNNNREQRRRERRERRHLQHTASLLVAPTHSHPHPHNHPLRHGHLDRHSMPAPPLPPILHPPHMHPGLAGNLQHNGHNVAMLRPMLPDILHNHFPPPYSALPQSMTTGSGNMPHHNGSPIPFSHPHSHPHHPLPQTPTATILGPPPPPPPAGTTLLTSVISTVPIPGATPMVSDGRFTLPLPIIRRSPSERSGKGCCGQWFAGPPLRALIAVVALGGVACALGGAALGATGLAGPPSSHFTAALLMIGVGVVLVTVSGAAWRMTAPGGPPCLGLGSSVDLGRCGRRPCSRGGGAPQGLLYPEFQHRPPPPSYQASMQEYRLRLLLLDRDRQNGVVRGSSPPPTYRSHAGSLLRAPLTSTIRGTGGGHSGTRCESSIAGSEYSFPPSYRSRNNTPGTISSERSIETEPSGRLLANEDIPEPLSVEQLSEYNSLQQRCNTNPSHGNGQKSEQKRNSVQLDTNILISKTDTNLNNLNSDKKDDLVTIVTITPQNNDNLEASENRNNNENNGTESREQIEILAHL
ncbi:probable serine/threonine-protein kinase DDB_G0282963 [Calliphora vicina]|uniref:probable serine/threonine-protein kinase DDB_G0282963 n=1 Tax=Calliphora vicina TaxID=7373 RepID=UPI00325AE855